MRTVWSKPALISMNNPRIAKALIYAAKHDLSNVEFDVYVAMMYVSLNYPKLER